MHIHDFDVIINRRDSDSIKWNVYPEDVLPMWVADSDFMAPAPVVDALKSRASHGVFGYSASRRGVFREAVGHWMQSRFGWPVRPEWIAFSPGVVCSLAICVTTFTIPGESILFLTPAYPPFFSVPKAHGRTPLGSSLILENGRYTIDFADLENKMAHPGTRMMFLCNPHNPTGRAFCRDELSRVGELALKHNVLIIADEIHCDYVFPGSAHIPFASLSDELGQRTLTAISPSKTFNIADMHASAVISANAGLLSRFERAAEGLSLHSSAFGLIALRTAYMECAWYADQAAAYIKDNIDLAVARINERIPGISAYVPEATYLLWLDCRQMDCGTAHEKRWEQKSLERFFLEKAKLALNSGTDYGPEGAGFMRLNLACPRSIVREALGRLERAFG
jgi:cystathionine beta-lyase